MDGPPAVFLLKYASVCPLFVGMPPVFIFVSIYTWVRRVCRGGGGMQPSSKRGYPVSRHLVSIIRECSKLESVGSSLDQHLRAVDSRQTKAIEFYLRACALRMGG